MPLLCQCNLSFHPSLAGAAGGGSRSFGERIILSGAVSLPPLYLSEPYNYTHLHSLPSHKYTVHTDTDLDFKEEHGEEVLM